MSATGSYMSITTCSSGLSTLLCDLRARAATNLSHFKFLEVPGHVNASLETYRSVSVRVSGYLHSSSAEYDAH